jgi:hypothetical protein
MTQRGNVYAIGVQRKEVDARKLAEALVLVARELQQRQEAEAQSAEREQAVDVSVEVGTAEEQRDD